MNTSQATCQNLDNIENEVTTLSLAQPCTERLSDRYVINKSRFIRNKTDAEVSFLESQFVQDPSWGRSTVQYCKDHLNLGTTQIYKWGFDKKKLLKKYSRTITRISNGAKPSDREYFRAFFAYLRMLNEKKSKKFRKSKKTKAKKDKKPTQEEKATPKCEEKTKVISPKVKVINYNDEVGDILQLVDRQDGVRKNEHK